MGGQTWTRTLPLSGAGEGAGISKVWARSRIGETETARISGRLGADAARELSEPATLAGFRRWLDRENCYVFTVNGFPYGRFHGTRVKEQVYAPDWSTPERVEYTLRLFALLAELAPPGAAASVSTVTVRRA